MFNLIKLEIKNCISSIRFKITFSILLSVSIASFLMTCSYYYGSTSNIVPIVYRAGMFRGTTAIVLFHLFLMIMPLVVCCIYSDSYYKESRSNTNISIISRCGRKKYLTGKFIVVGLVSFFSVFFYSSL